MKRGDLSIVASSLSHAWKAIRVRWDETEQDWNDSVRRNFEEQHIATLEPQVIATLKAVNRLSQVLGRAHDDCA